MRKEQKEAVYAAQEAKEKMIAWVVGIVLTSVACGLFGVIIYFLGLGQGKW